MSWYILSAIVPISYVRDHLDLPWDRDGLSSNEGITMEDMDYLDRYATRITGEWNWMYLSEVISMVDIRIHRDKPWHRIHLSYNPGITLDDTIYLVLPNARGRWNYDELASRLPMVDIVETMPEYGIRWDRYYLSQNPTLTPEAMVYIDRHLGQDGVWYWTVISRAMPISDIIRAIEEGILPNASWSIWNLSANPTLTIEAIRYLDKHVPKRGTDTWNWVAVAQIVPMPDILGYISNEWQQVGTGINVDTLSRVAPISYIMDHPDMPWNREGLSMNKDITLADMDYLDRVGTHLRGPWHWGSLQQILPIWDLIHIDITLDRDHLSSNPTLTSEAMTYIDEQLPQDRVTDDWQLDSIAETAPMPAIVDMMESGVSGPFDWERSDISHNPDITIDAIRRIDQIGSTSIRGRWDWAVIAEVVPILDILAYVISRYR